MMQVEMKNGHLNGHSNGHSTNGSNGHGGRDDGLHEPQIELCCKRLGHGSWCNLPEKHPGVCGGADPSYDVIEERPPLWRKHKGQKP
jgi:hypothetical protein